MCIGIGALPVVMAGGHWSDCLLPSCRHEALERCNGEDDGFLVSYCHDENTNQSSLRIWDAKTMDSTPLVRARCDGSRGGGAGRCLRTPG